MDKDKRQLLKEANQPKDQTLKDERNRYKPVLKEHARVERAAARRRKEADRGRSL